MPLMTYTQQPEDSLYKLWELTGVLSFTAVILPLVTPRQYVPFDISVSHHSHSSLRILSYSLITGSDASQPRTDCIAAIAVAVWLS